MLFVETMLPVSITVYELVKAVKDFSNEQFRKVLNMFVWRKRIARLTSDVGIDVSFVGFRSVCRSEW